MCARREPGDLLQPVAKILQEFRNLPTCDRDYSDFSWAGIAALSALRENA